MDDGLVEKCFNPVLPSMHYFQHSNYGDSEEVDNLLDGLPDLRGRIEGDRTPQLD